jgi:hypothetical protein
MFEYSLDNILDSLDISDEAKEKLKKRDLNQKRQRDEEKQRAVEEKQRADEAERQRDELAHLAKISSMLAKGHAGCGAELAPTLKDENKWPRNVRLSNIYSMTELKYCCCHRCGRQIQTGKTHQTRQLVLETCVQPFSYC